MDCTLAHENREFVVKIAILTDAYNLPLWKIRIIEKLRSNKALKLSLLKIDSVKKRQYPLFWVYEALDYLLFSKTGKFKETTSEKDSQQKLNINTITPEIPTANPNSEVYDLLIDLSSTHDKSFYKQLSKITKKGICFFSIGYKPGSYPEFFYEMFSGEPVIAIRLNITDGERQRTLYRSYSGVYNFSLYLNKNKNCWKMSDFVNRSLTEIRDFQGFNDKDKQFSYGIQDSPAPSIMQQLKFIYITLSNLINLKLLNTKCRQQWFLAYERTDKAERTKEFLSTNSSNFRIITPPADKFFADPFIITEKGKTYVFFEEFIYPKGKGVISYLEIDEKGRETQSKVVLERDYHLSYPFVFKHEDKYYMIPETLGNKTIELYKAVDFPGKWELQKILFNNVNAVDTSLISYKGKFWLFTCMSDWGNGLSDELFIFYSDTLFGKWQPHPKNPVISDTKTARPAGKPFFQGNALIRPSQENSVRYGYALNFNRVDVLNEYDYKETLIKTIKPEFIEDNLAIHTFNSNKFYNVIDGMKLIKK